MRMQINLDVEGSFLECAEALRLFFKACPPMPEVPDYSHRLKAAIIWGDVRSQGSAVNHHHSHCKDHHMPETNPQQSILTTQEADALLNITDSTGAPINYGPDPITWAAADPAVASIVPDPNNGLRCTFRAVAVGSTPVQATGSVIVDGITTAFTANGTLNVTSDGGPGPDRITASLQWTDVRMQQ